MASWLNLRSVEIFVAAVEEDNMSRAAERLGLTQSAVSQAIAGLERSVGAQLIDRSIRPARLTLLGSTFYKGASELLGRARELEQIVELDLDKPLPLLRIGMVDSFATTVGPHLVRELDSIAAQWSVMSGVNETSTRALLERRVDFMITSDPSHSQADLVALPIMEEPFFIVAPPAAKARNVESLLAELPFVRYSRSSFIGQQIDNFVRDRGVDFRYRYELDTSDAVLSMVSAGIGWTLTTPLVVLKSMRPEADLRFYPLRDHKLTRSVWLVAQRTENAELIERIATAARNAVKEFCLPRIAQLAPWVAKSVRVGGDQKRSADGRRRIPANR